MNNDKNISQDSGQSPELKGAWLKLAAEISEGILADWAPHSPAVNMFGRSVYFSSMGGLSFLLGLSSNGLRVSAWLNDNQIRENIGPIAQASRQHLPLVVLAETDNESDLYFLAKSNCFQLRATRAQEVIDFTMIAHRIAGLSLVPGIVAFQRMNPISDFSLPGRKILSVYLGDPDDQISSPSPAQQIFFGKHRRRIPDWFNTDVPVLTGAGKNARGMAFESAANEAFFQRHLQEFVERAFGEFSSNTGRVYEPSSVLNNNKSVQKRLSLDIPYFYEESDLPKHHVLMQTIAREYPELKVQNKTLSRTDNHPVITPANIPLSIRKYKDKGPAYSRISDFYNTTALLYEDDKSEYVADPFQAIPVMPPATAGLKPQSSSQDKLPVLDPQKCTGCGECFVYCPHSAIPPLALNLESCIRSGILMAQKKGVSIAQIMPMVKPWVKLAAKEIKASKDKIKKLADFLPAAFEQLSEQAKLEGEKLQALSAEAEKIVQEIGGMEMAITEKFFNGPEATEAGSGELFFLAVDANNCTGCGLCENVCDEDALALTRKSPGLITKLEKQFSLLELLPDTSGDTITRLINDNDYNSLAAILLSRNAYMSMTGSSNSENISPLKTMLHISLSVMESVMQPKYTAFSKVVNGRIEKITEIIKKQLLESIPVGKPDGLADALSENLSEKIPIEQVIERWAAKERLKHVDRQSLLRKAALVKELRQLDWVINEGLTGKGRSRYGLVIDASLASIAEYPWNNFNAPAIVCNGASPELVKGLVQGQIRHLSDNLKIVRRAKLEEENKYDPAVHDEQIARLNWWDLTEEEKSFAPPVLLLSKRSIMQKSGISILEDILNIDYPVKVIILDDAVPPSDRVPAYISGSNGELLLFVALQKASVLKSSLAGPEHMFTGLVNGLNSSGPGLFWLFAASPEKHNLPAAQWHKLSSLALNTGAFAHFIFTPSPDKCSLSSQIDIGTIPAGKDWISDTLEFKQDGEDKTMEYSLTWADWAYSLKEWKPFFTAYDSQTEEAVAISDFINYEEKSRIGKVPVITRIDNSGELRQYVVPEAVVEGTKTCLGAWNTLRELAGTITVFPEKLRQQVEDELTAKYKEEKDKLIKEHEEQAKKTEQEHLEKIKIKIREKLMVLSTNPALQGGDS